jgi:predicted nucleotidyltransferase
MQPFYQAGAVDNSAQMSSRIRRRGAVMRYHEIEIPRVKLAECCQRNHIRKLSLFGSILRDDFGPDSDIDILVEFEPGHTPGLFGIAGMEIELSEMIGRKADLRTLDDVSRYFRDAVVREAQVQYAA